MARASSTAEPFSVSPFLLDLLTPSTGDRRFRPALTPGERHRVQIVSLWRVGSDTFAAGLDLNDPSWHIEFYSPRVVEVGDVGIVEASRPLTRSPSRWVFSRDELPADELPAIGQGG